MCDFIDCRLMVETTLATHGTDKVTTKITYVLLVKIVTDEPIKLPNFYR